jgi:hypothetical protein
VDQVQIQVLELEAEQAGVERLERCVVTLVLVPELGRDEQLRARDPGFGDRGADLSLVAVDGGRIYVAVPGGQRRRDSALRLAARLPDAQADLRNLGAIVQRDESGLDVLGHAARLLNETERRHVSFCRERCASRFITSRVASRQRPDPNAP